MKRKEEKLKNATDLIATYWKEREDVIFNKVSELEKQEEESQGKLLNINYAKLHARDNFEKLKKITEEDFEFSSDEGEEEKCGEFEFMWNKDKNIPGKIALLNLLDEQRLINVLTRRRKDEEVEDIFEAF